MIGCDKPDSSTTIEVDAIPVTDNAANLNDHELFHVVEVHCSDRIESTIQQSVSANIPPPSPQNVPRYKNGRQTNASVPPTNLSTAISSLRFSIASRMVFPRIRITAIANIEASIHVLSDRKSLIALSRCIHIKSS